VLRVETQELPVYALVQAKGGTKLSAVAGDKPPSFHPNAKTGHIESVGVPLKFLVNFLARDLGRPVNDETGLGDLYDFKLDWDPQMEFSDSVPGALSASMRGSIFGALNEQLGLRLEPKKGPVQVYVIEKIERPSDN
jgi:uncharacterized protein (TIGR03435 family)